MFVNTYGNSEKEKIILLAPMMISGGDLYSILSPHMKGEYYYIAPDQGGHGRAGIYHSADEEYQKLKAWLLANEFTEIHLLYGASLGVAVAYRLFMDPTFTVHKAWFDGVALSKSAGLIEKVMLRLFLKRKKMLEGERAKESRSLTKMYGPAFSRMMTTNFSRMTEEDIINICYACCHYDLMPFTDEQQRKLHLEYGEKDFDLRLSKNAFRKYLPKVQPVIRKGYGHCAYMAAHTEEYAAELEAFLKG